MIVIAGFSIKTGIVTEILDNIKYFSPKEDTSASQSNNSDKSSDIKSNEESESIPKEEEEKEDYWSVGYYRDEFNMPTEEAFIKNTKQINGRFSNSATTDSPLKVFVTVDESDISIFLYEYNDNLVKNYSTLEPMKYKMRMMTVDGTQTDLIGTMYCGGDRIYIDEKYKQSVFNALRGEGLIKFFAVKQDLVISTYSFSVRPENFQELFIETF